MKNYLNLLEDIIENGTWKDPAREGMPRTIEVFGRMLKFNLQDGFPLLTTKKMHFRGIVTELLWFLRGDTNIKYLVDNGCFIWNQDAYKYYQRNGGALQYDNWLGAVIDELDPYMIKNESEQYRSSCIGYGELGNVYGKQWRNYNGFDQINNLINKIKTQPDSRYHIVTAWNPNDFIEHPENAALPACHMTFQCSVRDGHLDMIMMQRSVDTFLGMPYNIASYALLTHIIATECDLLPGEFTWVGNSVHLYENHTMQVHEILSREPYDLCTLEIPYKKCIKDYVVDDFVITNYKSHGTIKAPLSVGK